jgi:fimbrial isopeptide formation D2 family protein/uncharacterized repeat protein (TIGR01451 family)
LARPVFSTGASTDYAKPDHRSSYQSARHLPPAQPLTASSPSISLNVPGQVSLGADVNFSVTFDNGDSVDEGYGPILDIILDTTGADADSGGGPYDGLGTSSISASYLGIPFTTGGANPTMWVLTFDSAGEAPHPLLRDASGQYVTVNGTPGDKLVVLRLPFGSFTPNQPPATVDISVNMSNYADVGVPLSVQARGAYEFGYTPLDDWCCGDPATNTISSWVNSTTTPTLLSLSKSYGGPEDEAVSGPNFRTFYPMHFDVSVSIAPGQSLSNLVLDDILPGNLQYFDLLSSAPAGATCTEPINPPPPPESPGGSLSCSWPGSVSGNASLSFDFYLPRDAAGGGRVINPGDGNDVSSCNNAALNASWTPLDPRDVGGSIVVDPAGCEYSLTDKSIAIQKTVTKLTGGGISPGDTLIYTLRFQISDFFAFNNLIITDLVSDGQHFDPGFIPTLQIEGNPYSWPATAMLSTPLTDPANWTYDVDCNYSGGPGAECTTNSSGAPNDGTTTLTFRVSQEISQRLLDPNGRMVGGCVDPVSGSANPDCASYDHGPTYAILQFRTIILDDFTDDFPSGDTSVDQGDVLGNSVNIVGDLLDTSTFNPTGSNELDSSSASQSIGTGTLTKTIYALNGNPPGNPVEVKPGDELTYRITYTLPTSDEENLEFNDFLPLPIFQVGDPDDDGVVGPAWAFDTTVSAAAPSSGVAKFGPSDTFYNYTCTGLGTPNGCLVPSLTSDTINNALRFYYGDYNDPRHQSTTVDLLFTVTVSDDPFADRLFLTNQVNAFEGSTNAGTVTANDIIQIILTEPALVSNKAVIWTSNPNAVFNPTTTGPVSFLSPSNAPRWSGTINSTNLSSSQINSNVSYVDAGDIVTFAIVIENTGSSINGAYDLVIHDTLPAEFEIPTGGPNLQIYYGDGSGPIAFTGLGGGAVGDTDDLFFNGVELVDPGGVGVCQAYDPTLGNNVILITFDLQFRDDVTPGTIVNTESLVSYAGRENGPNHLPTPQTDDAETTVIPVTTKAIVSSEIEDVNNARDEGVIGELVTYRLTLNIPEGNIPGAQLVDTLDSKLAFVQVDSVTLSPGVTTVNAIGTGATPANVTIGGTGNVLTFDFGDIDNTNDDDAVETIEIVYTSVVLNVSGNQTGAGLNNAAVLSWTGDSLPASSAPNLTVIEPVLQVGKSALVNGVGTSGDAGDPLVYTITVQHAGSSGADAFEVDLMDDLPIAGPGGPSLIDSANLDSVTDSAGILGVGDFTFSGSDAAGYTLATNTPFDLSLTPPVGPTPRVLTFMISGNLALAVQPGAFDNTATATWTSLDTDVSLPRSTYNPNSVERTGSGVGPNDYRTNGIASVDILASPGKTIVATSEAHTGNDGSRERLAIGEIVRYRISIDIPEGTSPAFQIRDQLPQGLLLQDANQVRLSFSADANITEPADLAGADNDAVPPTFVLPAGRVTTSFASGRQTVTFSLGNLINNDNDPGAETITLEFNALVDNSATGSNDAGDDRNNSFEVLVGGIVVSTSTAVNARISEPSITNLNKTVLAPAPNDAGDVFTYHLTYSNATGANITSAFDVQLTDTLDANLVLVGVSVTAPGPYTDNSSGNTVDVIVDELAPGAAVTVDVQARLVDDVVIGSTIPNTANLTYTSLPGTYGTTSNPTGSSTPGVPGSGTGERDSSGGLNDYVDSATVSLTLIDPSMTKSVFDTSLTTTGSSQHNPAIEDLVIGETVTFRITVTLPEGSAPLTITDNLPTVPPDEGMLSVVSSQVVAIGADISGSLLSVGDAGVVSDSDSDTYNDQVVFSFGTLLNTPDGVQDDDDRLTVEIVALVENHPSIQDGDLLVNDATADFGTGTLTDSASVEIVVLDLTVTKDDGLSIISPAEVLTYVIVYSDIGTADAYGIELSEMVPAGTTFSGPSGPGGWSCASGAPAGTACTHSAGDLPIGASGSVNFIVVVNDPAGVTSVTNTVMVGDDNSQGPDINPSNNSYTDTDNLATLPDANLTKTITNSDQTFTGGSDVAIGEIITYEVTLIVPEGTAPASLITDTLEQGLALVNCDSTSVTGDLTTNRTGGFPAACSNPSVAEEPTGSAELVDEGRRIIFDLGDLTSTKLNPTNPDPTLTITYRAVVLDSAANLRGALRTNAARWTWNGGDLLRSASAVTIVEPTLTLRKSATPRIAPLGTPITITLAVEHTGSSSADAFDLYLEDILPPQLLFAGGLTSTAGLAPTTLTEAAGTITATWDDFPQSGSSTIEFQVTLDGLSPGQSVTNQARLEWTSLPADGVSAPRALSDHNALATERRYDPTNLVDVYQVLASETLGTPALPETGFIPGRSTEIPSQSTDQFYKQMDGMRIVIPALDLEAEIVGVSTNDQGWDLTWLWNRIGYLEGTAYPTWAGNTALTGHIVLPNGLPGPFAQLDQLAWNDHIWLYSNGLRYEYQVTYQWKTHPNDLSVFNHEDLDVLTLITCAVYDPTQEAYRQRTIVRAVLVRVEDLSFQP